MLQSPDRQLAGDPLVSVVIICFNQEKYIGETIRGVVGQTYSSLEIIVADDGSSDATADIAEEILSKSGRRFVIMRSERNQGITENTNRAFMKAAGSYIAYLGGDDLWDARKIKRAVDCLQAIQHASMFAHAMRYIDSQGRETGEGQIPRRSIAFVDAPQVFSGEVRFLGSSAVIRNTKETPLFDSRMPVASDLLYFVELIKILGPAVVSPEVLGSYRIHGQSVSKTRRMQIVQDGLISLAIVEAKYPDLCEVAAARRAKILYGLGVDKLKSGDRNSAISYFKSGSSLRVYWKSMLRRVSAHFR